MPPVNQHNFARAHEICPLCSSTGGEPQSLNDYELSRCPHCEMVWDPFPPSDPTAIYQKDYYENRGGQNGYVNYTKSKSELARTFRLRLRFVEKKLGRKGRLLDVGCALGECLFQAKALGWPAPRGIEVSEQAIRYAQENGLDVQKGDLTSHKLIEGSFEVILLQDVIEHTADPIAQLANCYALLEPGGILYLTTPNVEGFWSKVSGARWVHYRPHEHLSYFSNKTIRAALRAAGFNHVEVSIAVKYMSLEYILGRIAFFQKGIGAMLANFIRGIGLSSLGLYLPVGELQAWAFRTDALRGRAEQTELSFQKRS